MRSWIKLLLALAVIALLVTAILGMGKFALNILRAYNGQDGEQDPMFAEEAVHATMPPELAGEESGRMFKDNSANWDTSVQTPVDQTADELGEEVRQGADT